jgi:two-component system chemotaxis response regulator CheY
MNSLIPKTKTSEPAEIVECSESTREHFRNIWAPWLKQVSGRDPEPEDEEAISKPEAFYIAKGGMVYFAKYKGEIVGCVAIKKLSYDTYEFCKLVVIDSAKGLGIGKQLVEKCIAFAIERGAKQLTLQTFRLSALAIEMYRRMGFKEITPPAVMSVLQRTEIIMGLNLTPILIVDDYHTARDIVSKLLNELGFKNIDAAASGAEALKKMREKSYGLVIADWNMESMAGIELLKKIRADEKLKNIPFIVISADSKPENVAAIKQAGMNAYITKPFNADTLKSAMSDFLSRMA